MEETTRRFVFISKEPIFRVESRPITGRVLRQWHSKIDHHTAYWALISADEDLYSGIFSFKNPSAVDLWSFGISQQQVDHFLIYVGHGMRMQDVVEQFNQANIDPAKVTYVVCPCQTIDEKGEYLNLVRSWGSRAKVIGCGVSAMEMGALIQEYLETGEVK